MSFPKSIPRIARKVFPARVRTALRRSRVLRQFAATLFSGTAHRSFPDSKFELYYDGFRNIGFGANLDGYELAERVVAKRILSQRPPKSVWDIGANIGIWSLFFTSLCPPDTEIRCFEPDPKNLELLRLTMLKNKINNWEICPVALSNREGVATFFSDPVSGATGSLEFERDFVGRHFGALREQYSVSISTIDKQVALSARPPDFIKIDVEGHEFEVLEGAIETLNEFRPLLVFETTRNHSEVAQLFQKLNYRLLNLAGEPVDLPLFSTIAIPSEVELHFSSAS